jgi:hypothetical protein
MILPCKIFSAFLYIDYLYSQHSSQTWSASELFGELIKAQIAGPLWTSKSVNLRLNLRIYFSYKLPDNIYAADLTTLLRTITTTLATRCQKQTFKNLV